MFGHKKASLFVIICLAVLSVGVLAASVDPVLFDDWQAGDADSECEQADCDAEYAYKIDEWNEPESMDGSYLTGQGNTITISNDDGYTFDWDSQWSVTCVIVKAAGKANVFYYPNGAYGDTELFAPMRVVGGADGTYQISHVTFCYNSPQEPPTVPVLPLMAIPAGLTVAGLLLRRKRDK